MLDTLSRVCDSLLMEVLMTADVLLVLALTAVIIFAAYLTTK